MQPILCSKSEAARALGVSIRTIENLVAQKLLISRKVGRRRMIPCAALAQFAGRDTPVITGIEPQGEGSNARRDNLTQPRANASGAERR